MSEFESHVGKLIPIKTSNIESTAKEILEKNCPEYDKNTIGSLYKSFVEALCDYMYNDYCYIRGILYNISDTKHIYGDSEIIINSDNTIDYSIDFNNNGADLREALEEEIERIVKTN